MRNVTSMAYRERVSPDPSKQVPVRLPVEARPRVGMSRAVRTAMMLVVIVAAYVAAATQMTQMLDSVLAVPVAWAVAAVQVFPLSMVGRFPCRVWLLTSTGLLLGSFTAVMQGNESLPWPAMTCCAALVSLGVMAVHDRPALAWIFGLAGLGIPVGVAVVTVPVPPVGVAIIMVCGAVVISFSSLYGRWRAARNDLWIEQLRTESASREIALMEERARIAREIHDVVAHHVSMIAIQAQAAQVRDADMIQKTSEAFTDIHHAADSALTEMRTVVDGLRDGGQGVPDRPVSTGLGDLVAQTRRAGVDVAYRVEGLGAENPPLPDGVAAATYRIVQESLTNVIRHAKGESVEVQVVRRGDELKVKVANTCAHGETAISGSDGKGLLGMRERVRIYGGTFEAGRRPGSFVVVAVFPLPSGAMGDVR